MKVCIYGRATTGFDYRTYIEKIKAELSRLDMQYTFIDTFGQYLSEQYNKSVQMCTAKEFREQGYDALISIGGDGTVLDTLEIVRDSQIPVLGINLGRLGFLANVIDSEIEHAFKKLKLREYTLSKRKLLEVISEQIDIEFPYTLNDFVVQKRDSSAMITLTVSVDGSFLNKYWADGLIISTPTGSTGYSLSCGGPIVLPGSASLVVTPIAAHNLTVRPVVIPDTLSLNIEVKSRSSTVLISMDSRSFAVDANAKFQLQTAPFTFDLITFGQNGHLDTLRQKLHWGLDIRNNQE